MAYMQKHYASAMITIPIQILYYNNAIKVEHSDKWMIGICIGVDLIGRNCTTYQARLTKGIRKQVK